MNLLYEFFLIYFIIHVILCYVSGKTVVTEQGSVLGIPMKSRNGTIYYGYFGIPYAKPPLGNLRFQDPQEPDSWNGTRDAMNPSPKCIQWDRFLFVGVFGSEDCLYLNVFTPSTDTNANMPVMVCIHGGAFFRGESAECFPTYFMDKKIVMVTFDYRLGILGFLSAGNDILPGNYGMKDQSAVLRWVNKNIRNFGGNPDSVTIFGESAGGASVHLHMYSPLSQGLFHRAISQSGSAMVPWATTTAELSQNKTYTLAILAGCTLMSDQLLVDCLRTISVTDLVGILGRFFVWNYEPAVIFPVVVEPDIEGAFLIKAPKESEELSKVPWIVGITSGEGGIVAAEYLSRGATHLKEFGDNYMRYMPISFYYFYTAPINEIDRITRAIKEYYFQDKEIGLTTAFQLRDMVTDGGFAYHAIKSTIKYSGTCYFYYYDHQNQRSFNEIWGQSIFLKYLGVSHGDDLISLFPQFWIFPIELTGYDLLVSNRMVNYWTNFAYNGDPNDDRSTQTKWEHVKSSDLEYLHIKDQSDEMGSGLLKGQFSFWDQLPLKKSSVSENISLKETKTSVPTKEEL